MRVSGLKVVEARDARDPRPSDKGARHDREWKGELADNDHTHSHTRMIFPSIAIRMDAGSLPENRLAMKLCKRPATETRLVST